MSSQQQNDDERSFTNVKHLQRLFVERLQLLNRRRVAIVIVVSWLMAALVIIGLRSRRVSNLRVEHEIAQVHGLVSASTYWEGKALRVEGVVQTEADFIELSRRLAKIVGAGYVVNNARILISEKVFEPNERIGVVTIRVNSRYDDSLESLKQISEIIHLPQFETLPIRRNSTLSSLILNRYHFGSSDLPRSYGLIVERIRELNKLRDINRIKSKVLRVPILPARAQQLNADRVNTQPGFAFYSAGSTAFALNHVIAERPATLPKSRRKSEPTSLLSFPITPSTLVETRRLVTTVPVEVTSAKIRIRLADRAIAATDIHKTLSEQGKIQLQNALKRHQNRKATVFVLDDGWPDKESYDKSIAELQHLSDVVRAYYGLAPISITHSQFVALTNPHPHCVSIRDSLTEFTEPDKTGVVKVVYLPLSRAQNSSGVLEELLRLHFIIKAAKQNGVVDDARLQYAQKEATAALGNVLPAFDDQKIDTDEAILQAIWSVADFVAQKSSGRDVFFVNESWTVTAGSVSDARPGNSAGIAVVAAGNVPGKVVNSDNGAVDFARQCASTKSVLAVLNVIKDKGLACQSSIVKDKLLDETFVAAYDGEVIPGASASECHDPNVDKCGCGTSFSAPRLAWMLALNEALRSEDVDYADWNVLLYKRVKGTRTNDNGIPWSGIYLRLEDLLKSK